MNAPWRFELLGGLRAQRGPIVFTRCATSRVTALLARLCLFPQQIHPREELIDLLWPDADMDAGRNSLRVAIASLRRQLEPPGVPPGAVLIADRSAIRLNPIAFRSDVADFEAVLSAARSAPSPQDREELDRALLLFRGELLPGFYDDWIVSERERLNALHEAAWQQRETLLPVPPPEMLAVKANREPAETPLMGFPLQFTRFFGREQDCAVAAELVASGTRLITLSGPGGAGKTRLACEVARLVAAQFAGPICWVTLADLSQASLIPDAIAQALELPRAANVDPLNQAVTALAAQPPALLVLDNFEHLVERGAPLLFSLLSRVPHLTCLVTSRRRLGLQGEREQIVAPFPLPDLQGAVAQIAMNAGVQLFVDRAQAARPDFQITSANAASIAALCHTLDGIPLALELVAARTPVLNPAQIAERLSEHLLLMPSRKDAKGERHGSLRATIAWSYELIPPALQKFFTGLALFRGGCTIESAKIVCDEPLALELLTQLRERSLVMLEDGPEGIRFRLLETLRAFGLERLEEQGRYEILQAKHRNFFLALAEIAQPHLTGPDAAVWQTRLGADNDNLRAAFAACLASDETENIQAGLRLAAALGRYRQSRGELIEGREMLTAALDRQGADAPTAARAWALRWAGVLALYQGDFAAAEAWNEEALTIFDALGEMRGSGWVRMILGNVAAQRGAMDEARRRYAEALPLFRRTADTLGIGGTLNNLGNLLMSSGELADAKPLYEEALTLLQASGNKPGYTIMLSNLGSLAYYQGNLAEARQWLDATLALRTEIGSRSDQSGYALTILAGVSLRQGKHAEARRHLREGLTGCLNSGDKQSAINLLETTARLFSAVERAREATRLLGAAERLREDTGAVREPVDAATHGEELAAIGASLLPKERKAAWDAGWALTWEQAIQEAMQSIGDEVSEE